MTLRYDQVADLIRIIDASACDELILETPELKLVMRRNSAGAPVAASPARPAPTRAAATLAASPDGAAAPAPVAPPAVSTAAPDGHEVRAPMVGTFYRSPSPDAPPFVDVGTEIAVGQPLCVIEVMKLFTTIYADIAGRVAQINAVNAELVEYGRVLFVID
jgi:acetyl-CoA carboxylase biotin carboxyl carrier protein